LTLRRTTTIEYIINILTTIVVTILVIGFIVTIHELGHFIAARAFRVTVKEFAIGMGPKIFQKQSYKTGIKYSLRLLPLGGYVTMAGDDEDNNDVNAYNRKPVWQRIIIITAGAVMNLLLAALIMLAIVSTQSNFRGMTIERFHDDSVSQLSGLRVDDTIISVDGQRIRIFSELNYAVNRRGTSTVEVLVLRDGEELPPLNVNFALVTSDGRSLIRNEYGYIGIYEDDEFVVIGSDVLVFGRIDFTTNTIPRSVFTVVNQAYRQTLLMTRAFLESMGDLVSGRAGFDQISGPVGIGEAVGSSMRAGARNLFLLGAMLSFSIGMFNLIPFPALDGGRVVFLLLELARRKPIKPEIESMIHFAGIVALFIFMIIVIIADFGRLF